MSGEEGIRKYLIVWDFTEKDDLIAYFAAKAGIAEDCPSYLSFYYNIQDDPATTQPKHVDEDQ
jgi:hypothetical protein